MNLVKLVILLKYPEIPLNVRIKRQILEKIQGEKYSNGNAESDDDVIKELDFKADSERLSIHIYPRKSVIDINQLSSQKKALNITSSLLSNIYAVLKWNKLNSFVLKTVWIQESKESHSRLVSSYKKALLKENPLLGSINDVGFSFYIKEDEQDIHVITGPVDKEQLIKKELESGSLYDRSLIPENFYLVEYHFPLRKKDFSDETLTNHIENSFKLSDKLNQRFLTILKGGME